MALCEVHVQCKCTNDECNGCMWCRGGLLACSVCGGMEGSVPSECPGERMTDEQQDAVYNKTLDFIGGRWDVPPLDMQVIYFNYRGQEVTWTYLKTSADGAPRRSLSYEES